MLMTSSGADSQQGHVGTSDDASEEQWTTPAPSEVAHEPHVPQVPLVSHAANVQVAAAPFAATRPGADVATGGGGGYARLDSVAGSHRATASVTSLQSVTSGVSASQLVGSSSRSLNSLTSVSIPSLMSAAPSARLFSLPRTTEEVPPFTWHPTLASAA